MNQLPEALEVLENRARELKVTAYLYRNRMASLTGHVGLLIYCHPSCSWYHRHQAWYGPLFIYRYEYLFSSIGIAGKHQYQNASLAVHLGREFTRRIEGKTDPTDIEDVTLTPTVTAALQATTWPGRCQKLNDPKYTSTTWFLDGAHTVDSLEFCVEWFFSPDAAFGGEQDK